MRKKGERVPQHVFTPDYGRRSTQWEMCVHCEAMKDSPREHSTYHHRFSKEKHPFDYIIQEQP